MLPRHEDRNKVCFMLRISVFFENFAVSILLNSDGSAEDGIGSHLVTYAVIYMSELSCLRMFIRKYNLVVVDVLSTLSQVLTTLSNIPTS